MCFIGVGDVALIGNGVRLSRSNPMRQMGAPQAGVINRAQWSQHGAMRNMFGAFSQLQAIPSGHLHPSAWVPPSDAGGLSSRFEVNGSGDVTAANLAGGLYGEATLAGTGDITAAAVEYLGQLAATIAGLGDITPSPTLAGAIDAVASLSGSGTISAATLASVVDITASLVGVGTISQADMSGVLSAVASLSGSGDITTANLAGAILATATLAGVGTVTPPQLDGIWDMSASVAGTGSLVASIEAIGHAVAELTGAGTATLTAGATPGWMEADITPFTELSPQNLAAAVWNALVANFQEAGSMGEAMATAGSGGLSPTQVTMLTELYRLAGLDATRPLVVTATTREAGAEIEQDINEAPAGTITVTRL